MTAIIPKYGEPIVEENKATLEFHVYLEELQRLIGAVGLESLPDTTVTNPVTGEVLTYNGTVWVNQASSWNLIDSTTIAGNPSEHKIIWGDYSYIMVVVNGVQPTTDLVDLRCTLGTGGTMNETSGDYQGSSRTGAVTTRSALTGADLATPEIANNTSNLAGETISGVIYIGGFTNGKGAYYQSTMNYLNSSSSYETLNQQVNLTTFSAAGQIDTYRLFFAAGNFADVGDIKTYGLAR